MDRELTLEFSDAQSTPLALQLARYRFHFDVKSPLRLPPFASSTLRGVYGRALRHLACVTRASDCRGCVMVSSCPYPPLFEPQSVTRARRESSAGQPVLTTYAIEAGFCGEHARRLSEVRLGSGEPYSFDMVLMTPLSIAQLPLTITAWQFAFEKGVGKGNGTGLLTRVEFLPDDENLHTIYCTEDARVARHNPVVTVPQFSEPMDVTLQLVTPLRIEQQGRVIKSQDLTVGMFLRHLIRRVSFQVGAQQPQIFSLADIHRFNAIADAVRGEFRDLVWHDWSRYSSRQKQSMTLGGLLGQLHLEQVPPELLPFVYLGQWLHVGKETSFGMGRYQWVAPSSRPCEFA